MTELSAFQFRRAALMLISLVLALFPMASAVAQLEPRAPTGSRISRDPEQVEEKIAREMHKDFAECVFRRQRDRSLLLLDSSDPGNSVDYQRLGWNIDGFNIRLSMPDCLGDAMKMGQGNVSMVIAESQLRGLLAEEAYLAGHAVPLQVAEGSEEALSTRFFVPGPNENRARVLGAFADCIVYHAASDADRLLRTRPASEQEQDVVGALIPAISSCVVEGQEVALTLSKIRRIVAEGLWSRSRYGNLIATPFAAEPTKR